MGAVVVSVGTSGTASAIGYQRVQRKFIGIAGEVLRWVNSEERDVNK
jgi:hypothetical protein